VQTPSEATHAPATMVTVAMGKVVLISMSVIPEHIIALLMPPAQTPTEVSRARATVVMTVTASRV